MMAGTLDSVTRRRLGLRPGQISVLRSWPKHFSLTVPISPPGVQIGTSKFSGKPDEMLGGNFAMNLHPI